MRSGKRMTGGGRMVSARSKTGNPQCSEAMSAKVNARLGNPVSMALDVANAILGRCRSEARARKQAPKVHAAVARARASGVTPEYKPKRRPDEIRAMGHSMGYKDVSNVVSGPKHTRHELGARLRKANAGEHFGPFWQGYAAGARQSGEDWMNHIHRSTGGRITRAYRRVRSYMAKV